ncbi:replication initiation factor domain-containing protein [Geomonas sp. Red32]|uniref:replication initiation factor domain-containing protein n=1 Tax=Geomonas sp. Red32 TaxID=2912856 RepID=UPI00202D0A84|nr:replication initiation factor domain-containing protein [Geomonas sp. Red32]MCM0082305.1 replication initiation factor domain-containing protein [Geomonas sp. Red32]
MQQITTGIDHLHLTFSASHSLETIVTTLFTGITADHFRPSRKQQKWYRRTRLLQTTTGDTLAAFHSDSTSTFGRRNLLQVHGLAFSDSALNALRPLNLQKLIDGAVELDAHVSEIDVYIDDRSGLTPVNQIYEQSLPHTYRDYIRSTFTKDHQGKPTLPDFYGGSSIYYGRRGRNFCKVLFYQKDLCPRQRVYETGNRLKSPWIRYELKLRKGSAKKETDLLMKLSIPEFDAETPRLGEVVVDLFQRHFSYVVPGPRSSRRKLQSWWSELLKRAALYNHIPLSDHTSCYHRPGISSLRTLDGNPQTDTLAFCL